MKNLIQEHLEGYDGKILFPQHHLSHAAAAFYPSPFDEAAVVTADGVGGMGPPPAWGMAKETR